MQGAGLVAIQVALRAVPPLVPAGVQDDQGVRRDPPAGLLPRLQVDEGQHVIRVGGGLRLHVDQDALADQAGGRDFVHRRETLAEMGRGIEVRSRMLSRHERIHVGPVGDLRERLERERYPSGENRRSFAQAVRQVHHLGASVGHVVQAEGEHLGGADLRRRDDHQAGGDEQGRGRPRRAEASGHRSRLPG